MRNISNHFKFTPISLRKFQTVGHCAFLISRDRSGCKSGDNDVRRLRYGLPLICERDFYRLPSTDSNYFKQFVKQMTACMDSLLLLANCSRPEASFLCSVSVLTNTSSSRAFNYTSTVFLDSKKRVCPAENTLSTVSLVFSISHDHRVGKIGCNSVRSKRNSQLQPELRGSNDYFFPKMTGSRTKVWIKLNQWFF